MTNTVPFRRRGSNEISNADLLRECGQKLTDRELWELFQERLQKELFVYLLRTLKHYSKRDDVIELVADLGQEVYVRLVHSNGAMMRNFRGENDLSVRTFLARVCLSVVADHFRREGRVKRSNDNVVSIEDIREMIETPRHERDELDMTSVLSWIDIERIVASDPDHKNAQRNALIFKLFFIDGLKAEEIARFPGFDLSESGVGSVLARLRKRIKK